MLESLGQTGQRNIVSIHQMQVLEWSVMARSRFTAMASLVRSPSFLLPRWLIRTFGMRRTILVGILATLAEQIGSYGSKRMWCYVAVAAIGSLQSCSTAAMAGLMTVEGSRQGMGQGELQAALGNLKAICMTLSSVTWGAVYELGVRRQDPSVFYLAGTAAAACALGIARAGWVPSYSSRTATIV